MTSYISAVAFPETISRGGLLVKLRPLYERIAHETIHNTRRKHVAVLADRLFYKQTSCFQPSWVNDIRSTARPIRPRPDLAYPRSGAFIRDCWVARGSVGANHKPSSRGTWRISIDSRSTMMDRVNSFRDCFLKDQGFVPPALLSSSLFSFADRRTEIRRRIWKINLANYTRLFSSTILRLLQTRIASNRTFGRNWCFTAL